MPQDDEDHTAAIKRLQTAQTAIAALIVHDRLTGLRATWTFLEQEIGRRSDKSGALLIQAAKAHLELANGVHTDLPKSQASSVTRPSMTSSHPAFTVSTAGVKLTVKEAAKLLGVTVSALDQDRYSAKRNNKSPRLKYTVENPTGRHRQRLIKYAKADVLMAREQGLFRSTFVTS